jgi:hypothetical protein
VNDDHLPADGQTCENCAADGHLMCWDGNESAGQFELFTQVHDVLKGAAA